MHDVIRFIQNSGPVARGVLVILAVLSVVSWMVAFEKLFQLIRTFRADRRFLDMFGRKTGWNSLYKGSLALRHSPHAHVFRKSYSEFYALKRMSRLPSDTQGDKSEAGNGKEAGILPRIMDAAVTESLGTIDRYLPVLSITVSASPFLGLFGTVWGVMSAFMSIGTSGSADISAVGPGIAEALITTVTGLAVAIPALIAYNLAVAALRKLEDRKSVV